jgi:putative ABC transport system permease protein
LLALVAGHWLAAFLVGVSPRDPRLLAASAIALLSVVAAAAIAPALRAARVDPITALRAE